MSDLRDTKSLVEERDLLLASLEDLEREHDAGDVDDADYEDLRADYVRRTAEALRALTSAEERDKDHAEDKRQGRKRIRSARRLLGRRGVRRVLVVVSSVSLIGLVGVGAASLAGVRLPGENATGSVSIPEKAEVTQQLEEASLLGSEGKVSEAISLYGDVLTEAPRNAEALCYRGWLIRIAGLAARSGTAIAAGDDSLAEAVAADPGYPDARGLYGVALLEDRSDPRAAVVQFRAFLSDHPSVSLVRAIDAQIERAYDDLKIPVPKQVQTASR